ncbi:lipoprotein-releasing ABC transporter permease subunit [Sphingomonas sp. BIUV-7]|uniref:Lipoprotein-releasing ABC transporter permease subunit n=1 Tax=Sphingomonas natans TaxID=3063330 RepID=A0ABT8YER3_9SPHN|nr:lipoprotein-releasing ABC transporter permease subunit [Sphingomonas sp. BIUV-7]MDO6416838.1 lipoprotein-releasing ABC transporter permease subunit [Sphingomonas sp. BIUV-7]
MFLNPYERLIARRYLWPGKGEGIIAVVVGFALMGVMLGVAALVVVMSVMNGFRAELFDKTTALNGHAVIQGYDGKLPDWRRIVEVAQKTQGVTSAVPLIEQPLMASAAGRVEGVLLRGMREQEIQGKQIGGNVVAGDIKMVAPGAGTVALGARLAEQLGVGIGGDISLISPAGQTTPFGTVPRIVSYRVAAVFEVGIYDYDNAFVVMPIADAQTLLMMGDAVGMVEVQTVNADRVEQILKPVAAAAKGVAEVRDWRQMNASLFEALQVERVTMFIVLSIIIVVAAFNILSSLIMLVRAKTRDIAILRTVGADRSSMVRIFVTVGLTIGALGTIGGLILAAIFLYYRQGVVNFVQLVTGQNLWDPQIRFLTELPSRTDPVEVLSIVVMTMVMSLLFTLYPALRAARTDPVQVLRYE